MAATQAGNAVHMAKIALERRDIATKPRNLLTGIDQIASFLRPSI